jgi:hypothetical protein
MMVVQPHLLLHTDRQTDRFVLEVSRNMLRQTNKRGSDGGERASTDTTTGRDGACGSR